MRVLLLRRSVRGGLASLTDDLAAWLPQKGLSVIVEDATWIPRETSKVVDRDVADRLRSMGEGFDLLHAFGYRAAWACAAAFSDEYFWFYTAYEPPPASPALVQRLNFASLGFCVSSLTRNALAGQGVHSLDLVYPGVGSGIGVRLGPQETRRLLEIPEDAFVVGSFADDGLVEAMSSLPDAWLLLGGTGEDRPNLRYVGWAPRPRDMMEACDLWVAPDRNRGYSRSAAEAMFEGTPVLVRESMREMVEEDVSGFVFADDDALPHRLKEIRDLDLTRQTVGAAGRIRAREFFDLESRVADVAQRYREVLEEVL